MVVAEGRGFPGDDPISSSNATRSRTPVSGEAAPALARAQKRDRHRSAASSRERLETCPASDPMCYINHSRDHYSKSLPSDFSEVSMSASTRSVFDLPKAHLHAHLILSARVETTRELAARYGVDLTDAWSFASLPEFIVRGALSFQVIRTPDDLARLCREFVEDEAAQGVAYTEPMMGVGYFARQFGLSPDEVFAIHDQAFRVASAATGVEVGYQFGILRHETPESAEAVARFAAERADRGAVSLGIAGDETLASFADFGRAFEIAREAGLLVVPHAGESVGPESV